MDIQDITQLAKNGTQIVPQFSPPSGLYYQNIKNNEIKDLTNYKGAGRSSEYGPYIIDQDNNKYYKSDWRELANENLPSFADKKVQNMTMLYNALEALKNRNFQERMYGERYQKIIKDIQKAGLNPYAINFFTPSGGFSGSSASIMSNYQAQNSNIHSNIQSKSYNRTKSENHNINKKELSNADWLPQLIGGILGTIGAFINPALGVAGYGLGSLITNSIIRRK